LDYTIIGHLDTDYSRYRVELPKRYMSAESRSSLRREWASIKQERASIRHNISGKTYVQNSETNSSKHIYRSNIPKYTPQRNNYINKSSTIIPSERTQIQSFKHVNQTVNVI
jgi:hypothetical protein